MFRSWIDGSIRYATERYPLTTFLPVAVALTLVAAGNADHSAQPAWRYFVLSLLTTMALVFQFRLWDDIADQPYDRIFHPQRVLSRAPTLAPFAFNVVLAGILNLCLLVFTKHGYSGVLLLNIAAAFWYFTVPIDSRRSLLGRHLLLLKYPAFVLLITPAARLDAKFGLWITAVYVCSVVYELVHDTEVRPKKSSLGGL